MRLAVALAILLAGSGCAGGYGRDFNGLGVVAGFYPIAWAAEEVGGDRADVVNLTPQGTEPSQLELSPRGVEVLSSAHVILLLRGFQPALDRAAAAAEDARVVDLLENASPVRSDPHVWLDPIRFARVARRIGDELALPARAEELASRLEALDEEFRRGLADCERRQTVTSDDAFHYLAARYRLELIPGGSAEAETVLNPIEGLTPEERDRGDDYFSVMRANLRTLREALGCR
jgi:zinc transport system substrate-binding protein